jgi:hypothetical protein
MGKADSISLKARSEVKSKAEDEILESILELFEGIREIRLVFKRLR